MWSWIRNFGELQILTRASYFMLIFVPVLASIWPAVRLFVNRYNQAVADSISKLNAASDRFEFLAANTGSSSIDASLFKSILEDLQSNISLIVDEYSLKSIEQIELPEVWVFAFLASLLVITAHLIYQGLAPDLVRQFKLREYEDAEVKRYSEFRLQGQLERARSWLKGQSANNQTTNDGSLQSSRIREGDGRIPRDELDEIERGARAEYLNYAWRNRPTAASCGLLYLLSLILIIWIIYSQTRSVFSAAGWL